MHKRIVEKLLRAQRADGLMNTECIPSQLEFEWIGRRSVVEAFDGGYLSSDESALLLREAAAVCAGASTDIGHSLYKPGVRTPRSALPGAPPSCACALGSEVSLGQLLRHRFVQARLYRLLFHPRVFLRKFLEPPGFLRLYPAVLVAPAVVCGLTHLQCLAHLRHALPRRQATVRLPQLLDDLFSMLPLPVALLKSLLAHQGG